LIGSDSPRELHEESAARNFRADSEFSIEVATSPETWRTTPKSSPSEPRRALSRFSFSLIFRSFWS
jgi:hypothetical protein